MKSVIGIALVSLGLVGCATPQQNAALAGAVIGAAVMSSAYIPPPPRELYCSYVRGAYRGTDVYGRPVFEYRKVCR